MVKCVCQKSNWNEKFNSAVHSQVILSPKPTNDLIARQHSLIGIRIEATDNYDVCNLDLPLPKKTRGLRVKCRVFYVCAYKCIILPWVASSSYGIFVRLTIFLPAFSRSYNQATNQPNYLPSNAWILYYQRFSRQRWSLAWFIASLVNCSRLGLLGEVFLILMTFFSNDLRMNLVLPKNCWHIIIFA